MIHVDDASYTEGRLLLVNSQCSRQQLNKIILNDHYLVD